MYPFPSYCTHIIVFNSRMNFTVTKTLKNQRDRDKVITYSREVSARNQPRESDSIALSADHYITDVTRKGIDSRMLHKEG